MDLLALAQKYHDFYAPAFKILVDGKDLVGKENMEITTVQVDNTLEGADQFSFTVNNAFDIRKRDFRWLKDIFSFGREVVIQMGYRSTLEVMLVGIITSVKTSFPASGYPQFSVSGYDKSYPMMQGTKSKPVDKDKESDFVSKIAAQYGLTVRGIENTGLQLERIEQSQESDFQFLRRLAERNGYELFVVKNELYFKKPDNDASAAVTLEWGKGLVSFQPEVNLAGQIKKVEVRGWDMANKKPVLGTAGKGDEPGRDGGRKSGSEYLNAIPSEATHRERQAVFSKQEAEKRAKAILKKRSEALVKGRGESIGIPEIVPDSNIELLGLGGFFSKTYYIEQSTHTVSASGYRTTFSVKDTTI